MQVFQSIPTSQLINTIAHGDCIETMRQMPANSVDFILTDPPYLVNYRDRTGRSIQNDANADWLKPAMKEAHRVLKQNRLMLCFYGWNRIDKFFNAWKDAGFQPVDTSYFVSHIALTAGSFAINTNKRTCWQRAGRHCRSSRSLM